MAMLRQVVLDEMMKDSKIKIHRLDEVARPAQKKRMFPKEVDIVIDALLKAAEQEARRVYSRDLAIKERYPKRQDYVNYAADEYADRLLGQFEQELDERLEIIINIKYY